MARFARDVRLYLWKNALQKRRKPFGSFCEIACPVVLVLLLVLLYGVTETTDNPPHVYHHRLTSTDEVPFALLPAQLRAAGQWIGMAPDSTDTDAFIARLDAMYPAVDLMDAFDKAALTSLGVDVTADWTVPAFSSIVRKFASDAALNAHCTGKDYHTAGDVGGANEPIFMGITFDSFAPQWSYNIRYNATLVPSSAADEQLNQFDRGTNWEPQDLYINPTPGGRAQIPTTMQPFRFRIPGLAAVQRAIDRAILNTPATTGVDALLVQQQVATLLTGLNLVPASDVGAIAAALDLSSVEGRAVVAALSKPMAMLPQDVRVAPFPTPAYTENGFYDAAKSIMGFFLTMCLLLPVSNLVRGIVSEKEARIREGMKMMGMSTASLNTAWFITYFTIFFLIALLVTLFTMGNMFSNSGPLYVFLLFFLFGTAATSFCFFISALFSRAKTAAVVGMCLFFAAYFPSFALDRTNSNSEIMWASLCPPTAFGQGIGLLADFENDGVGVTADTSGIALVNYSFDNMLWMLLADTVILFVLGWYAYEVIPSEFGVARVPWFPFTKGYWLGVSAEAAATGHLDTTVHVGDTDPTRFEQDTPEQAAKKAAGKCIKVEGLVKKFKTPDCIKTAVAGLDVTMYEDEIFCLLGHNGAGKSTTISMLSGLLAPTAGDAHMYGHSIKDSMGDLRQQMGVCPQHNVLWDDLTCKEHLQYFAGIKGVPASEVNAAVEASIREVGLVEKANTASGSLSGGQKRKLSVAIALIGDSNIVFLDEPTSGMDPYSRRSTWNTLKSKAKGRIIILTTHFMDEADLLGDRIGIMAEGALRCCGTPMFLKHRYGVGYSLTAVKEAGCNSKAVTAAVRAHVPELKVLSDVGAEISFQLPLGASSAFPAMMTDLDDNLGPLHIESYGLSVTTMEEVFLKVAQHGDHGFIERQASKRRSGSFRAVSADGNAETKGVAAKDAVIAVGPAPGTAGATKSGSLTATPTAAATGSSFKIDANRNLFLPHFAALLQKRLRYFKRDSKSIVFQLVIPAAAIVLGMLLLTSAAFQDSNDLLISSVPLNNGGLKLPVPYVNVTGSIAPDVMAQMSSSTVEPIAFTGSQIRTYLGTVVAISTDDLTPRQVNALALSEYLLATRTSFEASRYGAYVVEGNVTHGMAISFLQNTTARHAVPLFANLAADALLKLTTADPAASISVSNWPLPWTNRQRSAGQSVGALFAAIIVVMAFAFIPAAFIVFVVKEREVSAKHQQFISGVSIPAYWLSTLLYDCAIYVAPAAVSLVIVKLFDIDEFVSDGTFPATLLLFLFYGPASAAFSYAVNYVFKTHSAAQNFVLLVNVLSIILMLASFVMQLIESVRDIDATLRYFYRFLPGYCLGEGLITLATRSLVQAIFAGADVSPLSMDTTGKPIIYLACQVVGYTVLAIVIDYALSNPSVRGKLTWDAKVVDPPHEDDEDVVREATPNPNDAIRLTNIRKVYTSRNLSNCSTTAKVAVKNLNFGVRNGECFGFLGINGAGKTSTLQILSGDSVPTSGSAKLLGLDILTDQLKVRRLLGYCPQFDALFELLTVREHLELFAKIKGLSGADVEVAVHRGIKEMDLGNFENKTAGSLSGGNKRKLSVAIAMMGNPPVMFLDEPSTGMDPVARRFMWEVIERMARTSSIVLVSHSMEECEALCNRVGIMVGGRMRCVGSIQHLKNRFGQGYHTEMKLAAVSDYEVQSLVARAGLGTEGMVTPANLRPVCTTLGDVRRADICKPLSPGWLVAAALKAHGRMPVREFCEWWAAESRAAGVYQFMLESFSGTTLTERHGNRLWFTLPKQGLRLGDMFGIVEAAKERIGVSEYSLSQTSLEQIFNSFASKQEEETAAVQGMVKAGDTAAAAALVVPLPQPAAESGEAEHNSTSAATNPHSPMQPMELA